MVDNPLKSCALNFISGRIRLLNKEHNLEDGELNMGYHIFLVGENNFDICIKKGVYGGIQSHGSVKSNQINSEVIAGFAGIKVGDFAFFYVKNKGIYGLWKIAFEPFHDVTPIWNDPDQVYPYRILFEPIVRKFLTPVAMADVLDLRDKGKIWTFDLGPITKKSHQPITTNEGKELLRLLLRNNPIFVEPDIIPDPYLPSKRNPLPLTLDCDNNGRLKYEGYLNAWFMQAFAKGRLKSLIGDYRDFLNFVPTSFNKVMDIFLTHVTTIDSVDILHKFTCMELKAGMVSEDDLNQIIKYENWLIRKLADGDSEMVQSILVGIKFDDKVIEYRNKRKAIEEKTVRLIQYKVNEDKFDITLIEI
ncbi:MAG: EVE domain-containing protein [Candidatus Methanoperedens sp.]|nr:EVE domain-containing protein [Candidatus Methanoperedens sp.]